MPIHDMTPEELADLQKKNNVFLLDVRTPEEHAEGKIEGSVLAADAGCINAEAVKGRAGGKRIVVYCARGVRSMSFCKKLTMEDDCLSVYNLTGGIDAWKNAEYDVSSS